MEDEASINFSPSAALPSSSSSSYSESQVVNEAERSSISNGAPTEDPQHHHQQRQRQSQSQSRRQSTRTSYRVNISISGVAPSDMRDDVWSCIVVLVTFWFFASMTLILGFYGSVNLQLGPNASRLIETNPLLVQYIKVEELDDSRPGPMLFGFDEHPHLSLEKTWAESHTAFIPANFHKEWMYFLNEGSKVDIEYNVSSSLPLSLVIAKGRETLVEWIEDPSYPNTTFSWNIIYGNGRLQQELSKSDAYYIAVGNLNTDEVEVELNFSVKACLYNTGNANYRCSLGNPFCILKFNLLKHTSAVLTSPPPEEGSLGDEWYVKLSYGPRWITYFIGSGVMTVVILLALRLCNTFKNSRDDDDDDDDDDDRGLIQVEEIETEQRAPLIIPNKDEDVSSLGSSYESVSQDEEEEEDMEAERLVRAYYNSSMEENKVVLLQDRAGVCVVCLDRPRDCFFLPCGHCAACFDCGSRIFGEEEGCCPICRRKMKKVRKIFTV